MSALQCFRDLITERLTVAAEEILRHVETTVVEYEEKLDRQRKLLEIVCKPRVTLQRIELPQQHVCQVEEVLTEQQLWNQERNSSLDQEEPESGQVKEEQAEICTSHEGEQLEVKQEADTLMLTPGNEESDHMEPGRNEEDADLQHRLHMKWGPVIKLQRTELPQQHVPEEEEVLTEQQLWNQERNSSLDQEEPESLQSTEEQEADTLMLTPVKEKSDHMEPEPDSDHQLLSHSSPAAQSQDQTGSHHVDSLSNSHAASRPCITKVENCDTSKTESESCTGRKSFKCDTCGKGFVYKSRLIIHMKVHSGEKPFSCTTCGKCFISSKDLIVHGRIHSGERPYSCKTCGKGFLRRSNLIIHERIHSGEKPYSCKTCGKSFTQRQSLTVHERIHSGERPYSCKTCGRSFLKSPDLIRHERIHSGEKPYSCKTCGKCFSQRPNLTVHERIHSGERPYSCKTCGKRFLRKPDLISHERIHSDGKPYSCKTCGKGFIQRRSLVKHEITHTGEKPYSCEICGKCYSRKIRLTVHERTHSSKKP